MIRKMILAAALLAAAPALAQTAATAPAAKPTAPMTAPAVHPMAMTPDAARLDINTATVEQLAGVKGLTKAVAEAIVKGRPFKNTDELTKNRILPEDVYAHVKDLLTVKHN